MNEKGSAIGIIGGSGLYRMEQLRDPSERQVETPFGPPSDVLIGGTISGRQVYFLPRHGRGHRILPNELNHRANIFAMRSLNVRARAAHTFFGEGIAAHISFAEPISERLRSLLYESAKKIGVRAHNGGTYVNMDGPAFSTRAESKLNRRHGFDVIGMTNVAEAKLAREAEIALATMAMITDYDSWKMDEEPVSAQTVFGHLTANAETAKKVLVETVPRIPTEPTWPEHSALDSALVTDRGLWPETTIGKLRPILSRFL
jgi:5'-methylthioadenosine phosphorylase